MIVCLYSQINPSKYINCLICGHTIELTRSTLLIDDYFACTNHLTKSNELRLLKGWCRFIVRKRIAAALAFIAKNMVVFA